MCMIAESAWGSITAATLLANISENHYIKQIHIFEKNQINQIGSLNNTEFLKNQNELVQIINQNYFLESAEKL